MKLIFLTNNLTLVLIYFAQVTLNAEAQLVESATNRGSLKGANGEGLFLNSSNRWLYCSLLCFIRHLSRNSLVPVATDGCVGSEQAKELLPYKGTYSPQRQHLYKY
jgi:hypothetical protein